MPDRITRAIAVDVDGTLKLPNGANRRLVEWCRVQKRHGYSLMLWSGRGEQYAREIADTYKVTDLFHHICSKPGLIVDDKGWSWIKFTRVVSNLI